MSDMSTSNYLQRRSELKAYFDQTAADAWARLTSNDPVGRIRESVRQGRDSMRRTLLEWLPGSLEGLRLLDAGCGTGALSVHAAARGAQVIGVELAPRMLALAAERTPQHLLDNRVEYFAGDMLDPQYGDFDYVVAMDSLIHYTASDVVEALAKLISRTRISILFTVAPNTAALSVKHSLGRMFPRSQRAPAIEPIRIADLQKKLADDPRFSHWELGRQAKISTFFYTSAALEIVRR